MDAAAPTTGGASWPGGPQGDEPRATLVVFTLGAESEARRRPLLPERLRREEVPFRRACFEATLEAGRRSGCRLEVSSPNPIDSPGTAWRRQAGTGFAERLRNAFEGAFGPGGGPVVLVGSDTPGLGAAHVREALDRLAREPDLVVLGPARDGGIYLLAAGRPLGPLLASVRWCGAETRSTLLAALARAGRPVLLLGLLSDLDTPSDLAALVAAALPAQNPLSPWIRRLDGLLAALRQAGWQTRPPVGPALRSFPEAGRAPPLEPPSKVG